MFESYTCIGEILETIHKIVCISTHVKASRAGVLMNYHYVEYLSEDIRTDYSV